MPRERMFPKGMIAGQQNDVQVRADPKKQTIEGITRVGLWSNVRQDVHFPDRK
jgi:hypothetical protein